MDWLWRIKQYHLPWNFIYVIAFGNKMLQTNQIREEYSNECHNLSYTKIIPACWTTNLNWILNSILNITDVSSNHVVNKEQRGWSVIVMTYPCLIFCFHPKNKSTGKYVYGRTCILPAPLFICLYSWELELGGKHLRHFKMSLLYEILQVQNAICSEYYVNKDFKTVKTLLRITWSTTVSQLKAVCVCWTVIANQCATWSAMQESGSYRCHGKNLRISVKHRKHPCYGTIPDQVLEKIT